ncbi:hypothetical protein GCM10010123_06530 [Pilimelia anulata]|uniref:Secreted protein n=1 Tax=Pilimelia anulata TaxID=53371 RepID=A0A8J3F7K0_9ACTN|nr:hypothetical protein [Pilimelia anulata]GGJ79274.1 hypothetical protein GCM10010123_06530 [Pilimelia anulata]
MVAFFVGVLLTALLCGAGALVGAAVSHHDGDRMGRHERVDRWRDGGGPGQRWRDDDRMRERQPQIRPPWINPPSTPTPVPAPTGGTITPTPPTPTP